MHSVFLLQVESGRGVVQQRVVVVRTGEVSCHSQVFGRCSSHRIWRGREIGLERYDIDIIWHAKCLAFSL